MGYNPFTETEKEITIANYHNLGAIGVSKLLPNRSRDVIKGWAHRNGLKVSKEYRSKTAISANKTWQRTEETRKKIGDGHRKYPQFKCEKCGHSISHYRKLCRPCYDAISKNGDSNQNWKGGVSTLTNLVRHLLWPVWNLPIFERDHFTCRNCGDNSGHNLNAHHLRTYKEIRDSVLADNPDLSLKIWEDKKLLASLIVAAHTLDDGITLCKKCHNLFHGKKSGELLETPNVKTRAISSQAVEGEGSTEGSTTRRVSPNNNPAQERPTYH